jgi:hypothetical protein
MTKNGLTIMIHKHMAQSASAMERGDKKNQKIHDEAAKVLSAELQKKKYDKKVV